MGLRGQTGASLGGSVIYVRPRHRRVPSLNKPKPLYLCVVRNCLRRVSRAAANARTPYCAMHHNQRIRAAIQGTAT
jgi:hypothetical protein